MKRCKRVVEVFPRAEKDPAVEEVYYCYIRKGKYCRTVQVENKHLKDWVNIDLDKAGNVLGVEVL